MVCGPDWRNNDLRAHDVAYCPHLWHPPRLANIACVWRWRLCGITPAILISSFLRSHICSVHSRSVLSKRIYALYRLKYNICVSTHWWNINYISATCFGRKTASIRPTQNIYRVQYKCALYGIPYRLQIYVYCRLKHNICISTQWWNINYISATCFGSKTAIIRPTQNIYRCTI